MITKPRTVLVLAGIFIAGMASGVFLAPVVNPLLHPRNHSRSNRPSFTERNMQRLEAVVTLTPEQRVQVEVLMRATDDDLWKMRRESWRVTSERMDRLNAQIAALLTAEQQVKFDEYSQAQAELIRQKMAEREARRSRRDAGGPPPPPPPPGPGEPPPPPPPSE